VSIMKGYESSKLLEIAANTSLDAHSIAKVVSTKVGYHLRWSGTRINISRYTKYVLQTKSVHRDCVLAAYRYATSCSTYNWMMDTPLLAPQQSTTISFVLPSTKAFSSDFCKLEPLMIESTIQVCPLISYLCSLFGRLETLSNAYNR